MISGNSYYLAKQYLPSSPATPSSSHPVPGRKLCSTFHLSRMCLVWESPIGGLIQYLPVFVAYFTWVMFSRLSCIKVSFLYEVCVMERAETLKPKLPLAPSSPPGQQWWSSQAQHPGGTGSPPCPPILQCPGSIGQPFQLLSSSLLLSVLVWCRHPWPVWPMSLSQPLSASGGSGFAEQQKQGIKRGRRTWRALLLSLGRAGMHACGDN